MWPFQPKTAVTMLVSVNEPPLVAGEKYRLPVETANRLIVKGYAEGVLSRVFSEKEIESARSENQVVNFG